MVRTVLVLAVLIGLTTSTMMAEPKVVKDEAPLPAPAPLTRGQEESLRFSTEDEKSGSTANSGNGINLLRHLQNFLKPELNTCIDGNCGTVQISGQMTELCSSNSEGEPREVGTFSVVGTPQGTIRINTRTGESCLLSWGHDGRTAEWIRIQDPPRCTPYCSDSDLRNLGPAPAPPAAQAPAASPAD